MKNCRYLLLWCIIFQIVNNSLIVRLTLSFEYHNPYDFKKVGDDFFMDFSFFTHRFFVKNLCKFISQMGNSLGVYGTNYKVKKVKNLFRLALSRVVLLYTVPYNQIWNPLKHKKKFIKDWFCVKLLCFQTLIYIICE